MTWIRRYIFDFRFWIILYFLIRLYNITQPPIEVGHNWRQTTVTMVARNFHEVDNNILYPRVDHAGAKTGITGMEFPALNYAIYLVSEVFGYDHWYGRLINLIVSTLGLWYFFRILRRHFGHRIAFFAGFLALNSLWFMYSRKIMPDTFAASLVVIGVWAMLRYIYDNGGWKYLVLSWSMVTLGLLSKLPAGILLVPMVALLFDGRIDKKRLSIAGIVGALATVPSVWWYFEWAPMLTEKYGFEHFFLGRSMSESASQIASAPVEVAKMFYEHALKFTGFLFFLIGLWMAIRWKEKKMLTIFGLGLLGQIVIMLKAGFTFYHHEYYILPFTLFMAIIAGYGMALIRKRWAIWLVAGLVMAECFGNQYIQFKTPEEHQPIIHLDETLDKFSDKDDLIAINSNVSPTPMYFAHRNGWILSNDALKQKHVQADLAAQGCKYIVILKRAFGENTELWHLRKVADTEDWTVYALKASRSPEPHLDYAR